MAENRPHTVENKGDHYSCKACDFDSDDLTEVAQHVAENQYTVPTK